MRLLVVLLLLVLLLVVLLLVVQLLRPLGRARGGVRGLSESDLLDAEAQLVLEVEEELVIRRHVPNPYALLLRKRRGLLQQPKRHVDLVEEAD